MQLATEALNKNRVGKEWKKTPEDVKVVTGRIMCETSEVCFRVAVKEEKEISWHLRAD